MLCAGVQIPSGEQERKQLSMDSGSNLSMYHTARIIQCLAQLMVHAYLPEVLHTTYHQRTLFSDFFAFEITRNIVQFVLVFHHIFSKVSKF